MGQLQAADVLLGDVPPDIEELAERGAKQRRKKLLMSMMNPLALRFPLLDPEAFLVATAPIGRYVGRGDAIAQVLPRAAPVVRVVVPEADADLVLAATRSLALRRTCDPAQVHIVQIARIAPGSTALSARRSSGMSMYRGQAAGGRQARGDLMVPPRTPPRRRLCRRHLVTTRRLCPRHFEPGLR
ncbi:MAG: hypothetical protein EA356_00545 [Geminicoccaceae bacterium]|nr:MAG: hypothetical protein EA356_00545 [Geminicoccaceae bacterium]